MTVGQVHDAAGRGRGDVRPDAVGAREGRHRRGRRPVDRQAAVACRRRARWRCAARVVVTAINALWLVLRRSRSTRCRCPTRDAGWSVVGRVSRRPAGVRVPRRPTRSGGCRSRSIASIRATSTRSSRSRTSGSGSHDGVDPIAIVRAAWTDVTRARRVSGGSTLSMQLARLLEPRPRTIPNKLIDMFRALQLDARMSKREILEHYLARTPYGAQRRGHRVARRGRTSATARSTCRRSRSRRCSRSRRVPRASRRAGERRAPARAPRRDPRQADRRRRVLARPTRAPRSPMPATAPPDHAAADAARGAARRGLAARAVTRADAAIRSTLDAGAQALVEQQSSRCTPTSCSARRIHNGAVVVVDHRTREVVALVGNLDFTDCKHGGQIAMFERPRSPGSTLKPLLYALAIDRGLALPDYLVADVPIAVRHVPPAQLRRRLRRPRHAARGARALAQPAVRRPAQAARRRAVRRRARSAWACRARARRPASYGLSLIAGGIELTPLELAGHVRDARRGRRVPPAAHARRGAPRRRPRAIFGRARRVADAQGARRSATVPTSRSRRDMRRGIPPEIHWKTGTSFGFRDAWAVGSGPAYTAVVWTGNVDNTPSARARRLRGRRTAAVRRARGPRRSHARRSAAPPRPTISSRSRSARTRATSPSDACTDRVEGARAASTRCRPTPCPYHQSSTSITRRRRRCCPPAASDGARLRSQELHRSCRARSPRGCVTQSRGARSADVRRGLHDSTRSAAGDHAADRGPGRHAPPRRVRRTSSACRSTASTQRAERIVVRRRRARRHRAGERARVLDAIARRSRRSSSPTTPAARRAARSAFDSARRRFAKVCETQRRRRPTNARSR